LPFELVEHEHEGYGRTNFPCCPRVWVRSRQHRLYGCEMGIPQQTGIAEPGLVVKAAGGG
jgi:hypothetical protein